MVRTIGELGVCHDFLGERKEGKVSLILCFLS